MAAAWCVTADGRRTGSRTRSKSLAGDRIDVGALARLARLRLDEDEAASLVGQLGEILAYVEELSSIDLRGVEPCVFAMGGQAPLREDVARPGLPKELALAQAPRTRDGFFVVPEVLAPVDGGHGA